MNKDWRQSAIHSSSSVKRSKNICPVCYTKTYNKDKKKCTKCKVFLFDNSDGSGITYCNENYIHYWVWMKGTFTSQYGWVCKEALFNPEQWNTKK